MRLFLIRHGETVDNVAGVLAGSRDSALTSHGVLQIRRLASHLADKGLEIEHVVSSDLQRAAQSAEAICHALNVSGHDRHLTPLLLPELRERGLGSGEGASFRMARMKDPDFHADAEPLEAMEARISRFLDSHLVPATQRAAEYGHADSSYIVVAHGIILDVLFRLICGRAAQGCVTAAPEVKSRARPRFGDCPPFRPSWGNTGYLECLIHMASGDSRLARLHVLHVNHLDHLSGLKRTRGCIGSAQFDARQATMDSFFVRPPPNPG